MIGVSLVMKGFPEISVVIPVRNEEATVAELERQLRAELPPHHEILFVDDGSTDSTWSRLQAIHDPGRVRLVRLRAPSGKSAALMAGFERTKAPVVFTLDGDLQDDPAEIPAFLKELRNGYDLVSGWKRVRHDPLHKVVPSRIFNFVMRRATGIALHDMNCGFKCYRANVAKSLRIWGDQHRFIPVLVAHQGFRISEIEVRHRPREHGRSKYGLSRLGKGFLDLGTVLLRTRYRDRPAHPFGFAAFGCLLVAVSLPVISMVAGRDWHLALLACGGTLVLTVGAAVLLASGWLAEILLDLTRSESGATANLVGESRD